MKFYDKNVRICVFVVNVIFLQFQETLYAREATSHSTAESSSEVSIIGLFITFF